MLQRIKQSPLLFMLHAFTAIVLFALLFFGKIVTTISYPIALTVLLGLVIITMVSEMINKKTEVSVVFAGILPLCLFVCISWLIYLGSISATWLIACAIFILFVIEYCITLKRIADNKKDLICVMVNVVLCFIISYVRYVYL